MAIRGIITFLVAMVSALAVAQPVTITPPSASIEPGESVTLTASGAMYYQWSPATGLSTTDGPVTVASPLVTTTYTCSGYAPGAESVVNGDFEQGNIGFTSAYEYNTNLWGEGTYYVDYDAHSHHNSFAGHGHNGGNFMIVNGATSPGTNVWTEQISVNPNTYYAFSTWACNVSVGDPEQVALLQFSINGIQIGDIFNAPNQLNVWMQFYELWYSGNSTTATITILNQNTVAGGNDFGLDDISFCELVLVGAPECTVYVENMTASATADDTELCEGGSTILHALPVNGSGNYTFNWTPANTLDNPTSQHPVATPALGTTTYTCQIIDTDWGNIQDVSVTLVVYPNAESTVYATICNGESYSFYGSYYYESCQVSYTDHTNHGCDSIVWLDLTVYPPNDTTIITVAICSYQSYYFHGTEYNQDGQIAYYDTIDNHGCLKVEQLVLSVGEYQMPPEEHVYKCFRHDEIPGFLWDKNNVTYHTDTCAEAIAPDPDGGCDFKYRLNLKFHQEFYQEEAPVNTCDHYVWPLTGETFTETNHHIVRTFSGGGGPNFDCDSTYILDVSIYNQSPDPGGIQCSDGVVFGDTIAVVTNTEFFSFHYTFNVEEQSPKCVWDSCIWSISKLSWALEFDTIPTPPLAGGRYSSECTVYVAEHTDDYVVLTATVKNDCDSKERKFYLKSSFLGVEENNEAIANVSIVPNPNNGQMTLFFNHFEGKVNVKVYDVMGNLVDSFIAFDNNNGFNALEYNLKGSSQGVYFFVVNGKDDTIVKKVIINK